MVLVISIAFATLVLLQVLVTVSVILNHVDAPAGVTKLQPQSITILEMVASVTQATVTMKNIQM